MPEDPFPLEPAYVTQGLAPQGLTQISDLSLLEGNKISNRARKRPWLVPLSAPWALKVPVHPGTICFKCIQIASKSVGLLVNGKLDF